MTSEAVKIVTGDAPLFCPERPRPLMRALAPASPFPIDALGTILGNAAKAIHDKVQAPLAIGGQSTPTRVKFIHQIFMHYRTAPFLS